MARSATPGRPLDVESVVPFLLDRGLIDESWILGSSLRIWSEARRNRNLRIEGPDERGYFLKQADDPGGGASLAREAAFHAFCRADPEAREIAACLPRLAHQVAEPRILVFELLADASPLQTAWWDGDESRTDGTAAKSLGRGIAALHRFGARRLRDGDLRLDWLPRQPPAALTLHRPRPAALAELSRANLETIRILQSSRGLGNHLDRLLDDWRSETVIHADLRPDNVLVREPDGLWITDWELVRIGDPAWDLACALQGHVVALVGSMPLSVAITFEEMTARAELSLARLQASMRALWSAYLDASVLPPRDAEGLLRRSVDYAVAALVQWAYERAARSDRLPGHAVLVLQVAENLAADPDRGRVQLFGIPPRSIAS